MVSVARERETAGWYPASDRTVPTRLRERARYDAATVHGVLDEALFCTVAFVVAGEPRVLPTLHARVDDTVYIHGSTGGALGALARGGVRVALTATVLDGFVLAKSAFHHSANYRSVVVHGNASPVTDAAAKLRVLAAFADRIVPGRSDDCRSPNARELAATVLLAVRLEEVSAKVRAGGPNDEPEDLALPHWSGVLPVATATGQPVPAPGETLPVPRYLAT